MWEEKILPKWFVHSGGLKKKCLDSACNKRLPGPFKQEFQGDKFIGLSSKLFTIVSKDSKKDGEKVACKGLMKSRLHKDDSDRFEASLNSGGQFRVPWTTFQRSKADMMTIAAERNVSNKYSKRKICPDDKDRTLTWDDQFDCSTPEKKRKIWQKRKDILIVKRKQHSEKGRKNKDPVVDEVVVSDAIDVGDGAVASTSAGVDDGAVASTSAGVDDGAVASTSAGPAPFLSFGEVNTFATNRAQAVILRKDKERKRLDAITLELERKKLVRYERDVDLWGHFDYDTYLRNLERTKAYLRNMKSSVYGSFT